MKLHHHATVKRIASDLRRAVAEGKRVKFVHGSTNSTRNQEDDLYHIDVGGLNHIIEVSTAKNYLLTEPNVPMDVLVDATLKHGLLPRVIMEFPGITVGGGIEGAALESSSFRNGQFSDSSLEYEAILADGTVLTLSPKEHKDLFYGTHGSYGSLCLITAIKLELVPAKRHVKLTYKSYPSVSQLMTAMQDALIEEYDYIDAILFKGKNVLLLGKQTTETGVTQTFSRASDPWFYNHVEAAEDGKTDIIPTKEFLFRYDRGAFWTGECGFRKFHVPSNRFTKWLVNPIMRTRRLYRLLHALNASQEGMVQDFYVPWERTEDLVYFSDQQLGIYPLWLCPVRPTRNPEKLSPHHSAAKMMVDVGIWGQSRAYLRDPIGMNRLFEKKVKELGGRKMFYAHSYYTETEFWRIYDKKWYDALRKKYKAERLPSIYEKVTVKGKYHPHHLVGLCKFFWGCIVQKY